MAKRRSNSHSRERARRARLRLYSVKWGDGNTAVRLAKNKTSAKKGFLKEGTWKNGKHFSAAEARFKWKTMKMIVGLG